MGWLDDLATGGAGGAPFPEGDTVYRLRAAPVWDPYAEKWVEGDWTTPDTLELPGAYVAQSSTSAVGNATRSQALEAKSLYCDPDADVIEGDRIRLGGPGGPIFPLDGIPAADKNPWTGWRPVREIPLARATG